MTGIRTAHLNLVRVAFTGLIIGAGSRVAGNLGRLVRRAAAACHSVVFALLKTFTACLVCDLGALASYMDVVLATGIFLVKGAVYNRTI